MPQEWRRFIYCAKEGQQDLPEGTITVPNAGREAGQYVRHIVSNYDDLAEVTLFLQGMPWDHNGRALADLFLTPAFPELICYVGAAGPKKGGWGSGKPFFPWTREIIEEALDGEEMGNSIPFSVGAQFYVKREVILARPLAFYERLLEAMAKREVFSPGHLLEPCWGNVFDWERFDSETPSR